MFAYYAYLLAFWTITPALGWLAYRRRDWSILRCALVMAFGELGLQLWFMLVMPDNWSMQPAYAYALVYLIQCVLVTVHPSNKLCSFIGGLFLSGFTISVVHMALAHSPQADHLFWMNNLMLGWMTILVLAGGSTGEAGRDFLVAAWGRVVRLARSARIAGHG